MQAIYSQSILLAMILGVAAASRADEVTDPSSEQPIRAIMFTGGCCHDYDMQKLILSKGIGRRTNVEWTIIQEGGKGTSHQYEIFGQDGWEKNYDVVLYNMCFAKTADEDYVRSILEVHEAGMPAVVLHCTMHTFRDLKDDMWRRFLGVTSRRHGRHHKILLSTQIPDHPIMQGLPKEWWTPQGELYISQSVWPSATVLARGSNQKAPSSEGQACVWVNNFGKARVFGTTVGHHNETMRHPYYLDLVTRGMLWSLDKLDDQHFRVVSAEEEIAAQKADIDASKPSGKVPTPIKPDKKKRSK